MRILDLVLTIAAATAVAAMALVTSAAVFFRSVIGSSLSWPEEICGYLLVWTSFAGAYLAVRDDGHIAIDLLVAKLPAAARKILQTITDLMVVGFFLLLLHQSVRMVLVVGDSPLRTLEAVPIGVFMAALPISAAGIVLALCLRIVRRWSKWT
jgi:TRAP-type C4-dicarboxylate transport system permease small subunit